MKNQVVGEKKPKLVLKTELLCNAYTDWQPKQSPAPQSEQQKDILR